jgi:very-long-chain enoyl-CoA reductase
MGEATAQASRGPKPRPHNVFSYLVTSVVFLIVLMVRTNGVIAPLLVPIALWEIHFLRRTFESAALHRYAKSSVPLGDAIQEYLYYWGFAAWIAWLLTRDRWTLTLEPVVVAGIAVFAIGEAGNFVTHVMLAKFRPVGTSVRVVPRGFLFELVSCPNYFFEILTWVGFAMVTRVSGAYLFAALGAAILADWARKRHAAYLAEFHDYPKDRKRLVPFLF